MRAIKAAHHAHTALIVFAREPVAGKVKTRLEQHLGRRMTLLLYRAFLQDVLNIATKAPVTQRYLFVCGRPAKGQQSFFRPYKMTFRIRTQKGPDLGERMYHALTLARADGARKSVVIGSDCLTLRPADIVRSLARLEDFPLVLGPSQDGGYYLLGCRRPNKKLFAGIRWGTEAVLTETLKCCRQLKKRPFLLPRQNDIDNVRDLKQYIKNTAMAKEQNRTTKFLLANAQRIFYTSSNT